MSPAHSKLGASCSERWIACPGSVHMSEGIPDESSEYAMEGTAAHTVAEACLKEHVDASTWLGKEVVVEDRTFLVDRDMADAVQRYLDTVREDLSDGAQLQVEQTFNLDRFHPGMFGTNDACIYDPSTLVLRVYDYKHGANVSVDVRWNPQLMYYALGAAVRSEQMPLAEVELVIVQPRCPHPDGPVRRWSINPLRLLEWSADLVAAAKRTEEPDALLLTGDHCTYCPAMHRCPQRREESLSVLGADEGGICPPEPSDLTAVELGDLLTRIRMVDGWMKRVRDHAYSRAIAGDPPVGWKIVEKRATRRWIDEDAVVSRLHDHGLEDAEIYERKLLSPARVDKLLGREKKVMSDLFVKESTGTTLAHESDRRAAVVPALLDFQP